MMTAILLRSVLVAVVMVTAVGGAAFQAADDTRQQRRDPVAELTDMQREIARAVVSGDREGWSKFIDPEWRVTHVDGGMLTKAQVLEMVFGKQPGPLAENSVDDIEVRLFGDAAVVTGQTTAQSREGMRVVLRFTDFVVRRNGRWQVVGSQATALKGGKQ